MRVLQGPDLTNSLLGVVMRFRKGKDAVTGDIEAMFHQVRISSQHRDALWFLWRENGKMSKEPKIYRMTVHLFSGIWSPSCASFVVQQTAENHGQKFDPATVKTVHENFYVDDCLKSLESDERATKIVRELCRLLNLEGFRLKQNAGLRKDGMRSWTVIMTRIGRDGCKNSPCWSSLK